MKNLFKLDIKTLTIIILVVIILLMRTCGDGCNTNSNSNKPTQTIKIDNKKYVVLKHDTIVDYKIKTTRIIKPGKDIYHDTTIYVKIPTDKPIDTMSILKEYYSKNVYKDTLKLDDSLGYVYLVDTISKNQISNRNFKANIKEKHTKETIIVVQPPKRQLYLGINGGLTKTEPIKTISIGGLYKTKTDKIFQLSGGFINDNNVLVPFINGGIYWKIKLKK